MSYVFALWMGVTREGRKFGNFRLSEKMDVESSASAEQSKGKGTAKLSKMRIMSSESEDEEQTLASLVSEAGEKKQKAQKPDTDKDSKVPATIH